jgi:hypothetical protein
MHTAPMRDSDGTFSEWQRSDVYCRKCEAGPKVRFRIWESHCGGYTDLQYECTACEGRWWVEGPDA